jgi:endoglucanase
MHFSSLILSAFTLTGAFAAPAPNADPAPNERGISVNKKRSNFWFAGVNESGAEFGSGTLPGTLGTDYIFPSTTSIDVGYQQLTSLGQVGLLIFCLDLVGKGV